MRISSPSRISPALGRRVLDALVLGVAFALVPGWLGALAGAGLSPHPGWIAVLALSARDGAGGFFVGIVVAAFTAAVGAAAGGEPFTAPWTRLGSPPDLVALGACVVVSWVGAWHTRRRGDLGARMRSLADRAAEAEAANAALRGVLAALRARLDRATTSLSFLRDVAARLEGTDPVAAAEGAADLALARTGASAAAVRVGFGGFERVLAVRDARGPKGLAPLQLREADLMLPIRNRHDRVGVLALWGIPGPGLDSATRHDLEVIASWSAPALAIATWRPGPSNAPDRRAV